jgi:hypothetical protein
MIKGHRESAADVVQHLSFDTQSSTLQANAASFI